MQVRDTRRQAPEHHGTYASVLVGGQSNRVTANDQEREFARTTRYMRRGHPRAMGKNRRSSEMHHWDTLACNHKHPTRMAIQEGHHALDGAVKNNSIGV